MIKAQKIFRFLLVFISCILLQNGIAQSQQSSFTKTNKKILNKIQEIENAIKNEDEKSIIAAKYQELSKELIKIKEFDKAEKYLNKALEIYKETNDKDQVAIVHRKLAQLYEMQSSYDRAIQNYQLSNSNAVNQEINPLNTNDISRLQNNDNPAIQEQLIDSNIQILQKEGKLDEVSEAYRIKAENQLKNQDQQAALETYEQAMNTIPENNENKIRIQSDIAKIYESSHQYDQAIKNVFSALHGAKESNNYSQIIRLSQDLAGLYFKKNDIDSAQLILEEAYQLSLKHGKTFDAASLTQQFADFYTSQKKYDQAIQLYKRYQSDLGDFILADSSLIDSRIFQITEEKIQQLEKEKDLKDELIERKNKFNYFLLASVISMAILLFLVIRIVFVVRKRNRKIALQSLRREMNPHFIFNSLNSVNQFIAQNNELGANKYLSAYSQLMRNMMESSGDDFISLSNELELIKKYLDLEHLRFQDVFDYEINVDESLDTDALKIPNMLLQPHIENAIWHGLRYKEEKGFLSVSINGQGNKISIKIVDNGIGREKSRSLKTKNQKLHKSRGIVNIEERISLLNRLYRLNIDMKTIDLKNAEGTEVQITMKKTWI